MRRLWLLAAFVLAIPFSGLAQDKPAYVLYNSKGKKVSYKKDAPASGEAGYRTLWRIS